MVVLLRTDWRQQADDALKRVSDSAKDFGDVSADFEDKMFDGSDLRIGVVLLRDPGEA